MLDEDFDIRREEVSSSEKEFENALRPLRFNDFSGQNKVVKNLKVFVEAAKYRGEPLDHTLLHGPPGLGKTTLSNIIANELGVGFKITSGPVLDKPGDLRVFLHRLKKTMCSSLTKYTVFRLLLKNIYTPQWRIIASTS
jgi:Holliday junction DNA helicase RuvB